MRRKAQTKGGIFPYLSGMTVETMAEAKGEIRDGGALTPSDRAV